MVTVKLRPELTPRFILAKAGRLFRPILLPYIRHSLLLILKRDY